MFAAMTGIGPRFNCAGLLYGAAGSGKSTFLELIEALVPPLARVAMEPSKLRGSFAVANLIGKTLNAVAEIDSPHRTPTALLKQLIGGELITADVKNRDAITFRPRALHVIACNPEDLLRVPGAGQSFWDRWVPVRFTNRVRHTGAEVEDLVDKITAQEMTALIAFAVACGRSLLKRGHYTMPASSQGVFDEWKARACGVSAWIAECVVPLDAHASASEGYPKGAALKSYKAWAEENGYQSVNAGTLQMRLEAAGIALKASKGRRYFMRLRRPDEADV